MSDQTPEGTTPENPTGSTARPRRRAAGRPAGPPAPAADVSTPRSTADGAVQPTDTPPVKASATKAPAKKSTAKKSAAKTAAPSPDDAAATVDTGSEAPTGSDA